MDKLRLVYSVGLMLTKAESPPVPLPAPLVVKKIPVGQGPWGVVLSR